MKKRSLIIAIVAICLSLCAGGTIAYFTAESTATNVITAGNIKIELQENMISKETGEIVEFEDQIGIMPGEKASKIVQIKNTGDNPAYVRIGLTNSIKLKDSSKKPDMSLITLDINKKNWTEKDGYYYYNTPLAAGATTEPLFTEVSFDKSMDNMYQECVVTIKVDAQGTQVANNGSSVLEASGWPETK